MFKKTLLIATLSAVFASPVIMASEPKHFKGLPSETIEQALKNYSEYNQKLAVIMAKDALQPADMAEIHQLTYTLENALKRIEKEIDIIEDLLEDVHKASEKADYEKALKQGRTYLSKSQKIVP